jgi:hypothetical protein
MDAIAVCATVGSTVQVPRERAMTADGESQTPVRVPTRDASNPMPVTFGWQAPEPMGSHTGRHRADNRAIMGRRDPTRCRGHGSPFPTRSHFAGFAAFASPRGHGHFDADRGGLRPAAGAHRPSSPPEVLLGRRGRSHRMGETPSGGDERSDHRGRPRGWFRAAVCDGERSRSRLRSVDDRRLCPLRCAAVRREVPTVIPRGDDGDEPRRARYEGAMWVGWQHPASATRWTAHRHPAARGPFTGVTRQSRYGDGTNRRFFERGGSVEGE